MKDEPIPKDRTLDASISLLREGYDFIGNRCRRYKSDIFATRLMGRRAFCVSGEAAARMFYQPDRFTRKGAVPAFTLKLLQDFKSVQTLDGEEHRHRKQLFMPLLSSEGIEQLRVIAEDEWCRAAERWETETMQSTVWETPDHIILHDEMERLLCRSVCRWIGVPLSQEDVWRRTWEFSTMIKGAGTPGPKNWRGQIYRWRSEKWARCLIDQVRSEEIQGLKDKTLHRVAFYRDLAGELLPVETAAVELINVLRPTVAVARYITFAALALHEHGNCRDKVSEGDDEFLEHFVQEVRRFYPFFPLVGGIAQESFDWQGHHFSKGAWVILDLYGTNHDARLWETPDEFRPERFEKWDEGRFNFIPQGGGDYQDGHRCPGEKITIMLVKLASKHLASKLRYEVPEQDTSIPRNRFPTLPASGFVMRKVRP